MKKFSLQQHADLFMLNLGWRHRRLKTKILFWTLDKIPRRWLYWFVIQAWSISTTTGKFRQYTPESVTIWDTLDVLEGKYDEKRS